jgi:hypothetical protein
MHLRALIVAFAFIAPLLESATANADEIEARITRVPNAPVVITKCRFDPAESKFSVAVQNRTQYDLLSFHVRVSYTDTANTPMGQDEATWDDLQTPLASGDSGSYSSFTGGGMNEPQSALAFVTCRIESARFTAHKEWHYGTHWKGKLLPLQSSQDSNAQSTALPSYLRTRSAASDLKAKITVVSSWTDSVDGALYVHDRVSVTAGNNNVLLAPSQLMLSFQGADGRQQTVRGLVGAPPAYQKFNAMTGNIETHPEVDPGSDLGVLGALTVPANSSATVVVTFLVPVPAADPKAYRDVSIAQ